MQFPTSRADLEKKQINEMSFAFRSVHDGKINITVLEILGIHLLPVDSQLISHLKETNVLVSWEAMKKAEKMYTEN